MRVTRCFAFLFVGLMALPVFAGTAAYAETAPSSPQSSNMYMNYGPQYNPDGPSTATSTSTVYDPAAAASPTDDPWMQCYVGDCGGILIRAASDYSLKAQLNLKPGQQFISGGYTYASADDANRFIGTWNGTALPMSTTVIYNGTPLVLQLQQVNATIYWNQLPVPPECQCGGMK
jgi:hypothetical protein